MSKDSTDNDRDTHFVPRPSQTTGRGAGARAPGGRAARRGALRV